MGMSQELELFLWNSKKKKDILKNSGNQILEPKWLSIYGQKEKEKTLLKMPSIMFQKKVSHAGLERCDDRNFIFVRTITLMFL